MFALFVYPQRKWLRKSYEEIKTWEQIWRTPIDGPPPYQDANGDLWIVYGGALYHWKKDQIGKSNAITLAEIEHETLPFADELSELVVVSPNKGWAIGTQPNRILEYDGVFWNIVQGIEGATTVDYPLISVVNENEVWFGNGYRYINGRYEKFSETSFRTIKMQDSQNGLAIRYDASGVADYFLTVFLSGRWIDTNLQVLPGGVVEDKNGDIWFVEMNGRQLYRINRISLPGGTPDIISNSGVNDIQLDPEGDVWFSTVNGLEHISHITSAITPDSLSSHLYGSGEYGSFLFRRRYQMLPISSRYIIIWSEEGRIFKGGPFVFPSLSPIQDIRFDAVPATELPEANTQTRREVFIKNTGDGTLKVSSISSDSGVFRFQTDQSTKGGTAFDFTLNKGRIPSGDSLRVVVVYFPTEPGQHNGRLVIESNDRTNPTYTINLSGATLGSVGPRIFVTSSLQFDSTFADQVQRSTLRIRNSGRGYLSVRSISSNNPAFTVSGDTLLIPPLTSRSVEVVFAPAVGGENLGQLTILSDDPVSPEVKVALIGTGVVVPEGPISLDSYLAAGDQRRRVAGNAVPGKVYTFQLNVADAPEKLF